MSQLWPWSHVLDPETFASLRVGDAVQLATRPVGERHFTYWSEATVVRRTDKTVWAAPPGYEDDGFPCSARSAQWFLVTGPEPLSFHVPHPAGDGDKTVCALRISAKPNRRAAKVPTELTCERCLLRCLRSWQDIDPDFDPIPDHWPGWPWEDGRFRYRERESLDEEGGGHG